MASRFGLGRKAGIVAAVWAGVVVCGLVAGSWIHGRVESSRQREGLGLSEEAADMVHESRDLESAGSLAEAKARLEGAVARLRQVEGAHDGEAYVALLLDLASLALRSAPDGASSRREARRLLEEAWDVPDTLPSLRARIARDRGALEVLEGNLGAAESWYAEALKDDPEDTDSARRLRALRKTRGQPAGDGS